MKKALIVSLFFLSLVGCSKKVDNNYELYNEYISELSNISESSEIPALVNIKVEKLESGEYIYIISIDNPSEELKNIEVISIYEVISVLSYVPPTPIFPSSGIFDDKLNLIPGVVNHEENIVKGILLIGYIEREYIISIKFKILMNTESGKYYYVEEIDLTYLINKIP